MPMFFFKSILSIIILILSMIAMFTMFEILGRSEKRYNIEKLKSIHKANGIIYFLIFVFISYLCLDFIISTKAELSTRAIFHGVFAMTIIVLLIIKISFIKIYRQFYSKAQTIGILIVVLTFLMVGTSGGYYLLITKFGTDKPYHGPKKGVVIVSEIKDTGTSIIVRTDKKSLRR